MNSTLKVFGLLLVFFTLTFIGLIIGLNVNAQTVELSNEAQATAEFIKSLDDRLIYSEDVMIPRYDGISKIIGYDEKVRYSYKGDEVDSQKYIFSDSEYSNTEKIDDHTLKISVQPIAYLNLNGQVQEIVYEETSPEIWQATQLKTTAEKIISLLKTPYVIAATYTPTTDNGFYANNQPFATLRSGNAKETRGENVCIQCRYAGGIWEFDRYHAYFDTSAIADTDNVSTSSLWVYGYEKSGSGAGMLVVPSSGASSPPATTDFSALTFTQLSSEIENSSYNASGWNELVFNSTGTSTISKTGTTKLAVIESKKDFANNNTQADTGYMCFHNAQYVGTSNDPYLIVNTYTPTTETPTATTTADLYPCSIPDNTRIDLITGCKNIYNGTTSSSTITAVEFYYYQIPLAIWLVLGTCFIYLFSRLRLEYIMRLRK